MFERCKPYKPPEGYLPLTSSSFAILAPSIISSSTNPAIVATSVIKIFACITSSSPSTSLYNVSLPCRGTRKYQFYLLKQEIAFLKQVDLAIIDSGHLEDAEIVQLAARS